MTTEFTSDFFRGNRQRLRDQINAEAPIILTANGMLQRNGDTTYTFRQDSSFWYLTGINVPDAVLVIDDAAEYLIIPEQQTHQTVFDGPIIEEQISQRSGISEILSGEAGWQRLSARIKSSKSVATLEPPAAYLDFYGFYTNPARAALAARISEINPTIEVSDLRLQLSAMRMVKQPAELATIKKAIGITLSGIENIRKNLNKYKYEYEIEADLTSHYRKSGSQGHAFHPIVAAGKNACTIHYLANNDSLKNASFVLIDTGAEYDEYAADLGSTYWFSERTTRENEIYEAVIKVQAFAYGLLKPGVLIKEYEKQIEQYMGERLIELGLIDTLGRDAIRQYFPHATSHHVGLDAHDAADYERPLEPGMVLAVEPGIYISDETIGVRIENNVLVTDSGIEILSEGLVQ